MRLIFTIIVMILVIWQGDAYFDINDNVFVVGWFVLGVAGLIIGLVVAAVISGIIQSFQMEFRLLSKPSCPTFGTTINETVQAIGC